MHGRTKIIFKTVVIILIVIVFTFDISTMIIFALETVGVVPIARRESPEHATNIVNRGPHFHKGVPKITVILGTRDP
jgi:hypothetical protein